MTSDFYTGLFKMADYILNVNDGNYISFTQIEVIIC